jgi:hypothetical protein
MTDHRHSADGPGGAQPIRHCDGSIPANQAVRQHVPPPFVPGRREGSVRRSRHTPGAVVIRSRSSCRRMSAFTGGREM